MITTNVSIKIPKNFIRDDYLEHSSNNDDWKIIYEDTNHIKIMCKSFSEIIDKEYNNVDWKVINNSELGSLPPPKWLLIKLKEFSDILINDILIYGALSLPFWQWVINENDNNIIIIQLDHINTDIDTIKYNIRIITMKYINNLITCIKLDKIYQINVLIWNYYILKLFF